MHWKSLLIDVAVSYLVFTWIRSLSGDGPFLDLAFGIHMNPENPRSVRRRERYWLKHQAALAGPYDRVLLASAKKIASEKNENEINEAVEKATSSGMKVPVEQVAGPLKNAYDVIYEKVVTLENPNAGRIGEALRKYWLGFEEVIERKRQDGGFTPQDLWDLRDTFNKRIDPFRLTGHERNDMYRSHCVVLQRVLADLLPNIKGHIERLEIRS